MCMDVSPTCILSTICVSGAYRGQRMAPDPWDLELQMTVHHHVGCWEPKPCPLQE